MHHLRERKLNLWLMVLQTSTNPAQGPCQAQRSQMCYNWELVSAPAHCPRTPTNPTLQCHEGRHEGSWDWSPLSCFTQPWSVSQLPKGPTADPNTSCWSFMVQRSHLPHKLWNNSQGLQPGVSPGVGMHTLNPEPSYLSCPKVRPCCVKATPTNP